MHKKVLNKIYICQDLNAIHWLQKSLSRTIRTLPSMMLTKLLEFAQEFTIYIKSVYAFQNVLVCISFSNFLVALSIYRVYYFNKRLEDIKC